MIGRAALVLGLLAAAVYYPTLRAGLVSDDFILVGRIGLTDALRYFHESFGLGRNEYRPITALSFALDNSIWGSYAPGYHLTNVVLHVLVAMMSCFALHALTRDLLMSFVAAAAFLIHPIHHSRVAWIAARDATVASVFLVAALWLYVLSRRDARPHLRLAAILLAALAALAYEGAVILPALFFSLEWLFYSTGPFIQRTLAASRPTAPFWIVAFLYVALWQLMFAGEVGAYDLALDPSSVCANYGRLIYTLFWGHRRFLIGVAYLGVTVLCFRALLARKQLSLLAVAFVIISFVPYSFTEGFAHRFGYLSALGFCILMGMCLAEGLRTGSRSRRAAIACLAACLFVFNIAQLRKLLSQWNAAGELAAGIPRTLKKRYPTLPEDTVLVFKGIPHMHGQAVVFPTGLGSAIQREYAVTLNIHADMGSDQDLSGADGRVLRFEYVGGDELLRQIED